MTISLLHSNPAHIFDNIYNVSTGLHNAASGLHNDKFLISMYIYKFGWIPEVF